MSSLLAASVFCQVKSHCDNSFCFEVVLLVFPKSSKKWLRRAQNSGKCFIVLAFFLKIYTLPSSLRGESAGEGEVVSESMSAA